jgi:hypothetical protein
MKRIISAVAVLAIVGGALAFRTAGQTPNIYCFTSTPLTGQTCVGQSGGTLEQFILDPSGTKVPCVTGTPYVNTATSCTTSTANHYSNVQF